MLLNTGRSPSFLVTAGAFLVALKSLSVLKKKMVLFSDIKKCSPIQYQYFHPTSNSWFLLVVPPRLRSGRGMRRKGKKIYLFNEYCLQLSFGCWMLIPEGWLSPGHLARSWVNFMGMISLTRLICEHVHSSASACQQNTLGFPQPGGQPS